MEVVLELGHAAELAASLGVEESREVVPRGVVAFGGCYSYRLGCDPGGKTRAGKKEEEEEEERVITEKRKHNCRELISYVGIRA